MKRGFGCWGCLLECRVFVRVLTVVVVVKDKSEIIHVT